MSVQTELPSALEGMSEERYKHCDNWIQENIRYSETQTVYAYYSPNLYKEKDGGYNVDMEFVDNEYGDDSWDQTITCDACNDKEIGHTWIDYEEFEEIIYPHYLLHLEADRLIAEQTPIEIQLSNHTSMTFDMFGQPREFFLDEFELEKLHLLARLQEMKPQGIEALYQEMFMSNNAWQYRNERHKIIASIVEELE